MENLLNFESLLAVLTLTLMEVVLGIDNIVFISIVVNKLPKEEQSKARIIGLAGALIFRIGMLLGISWIISMKDPIFHLFNKGFSIRDIILLGGGLFLLYKSIMEIHHKMAHDEFESQPNKTTFWAVITQIIMLDIIFSFDSILTAVGLVDQVSIMIIAVIIAMAIMMLFAAPISNVMNKYPTLQILALSFLILIAVMLGLESVHIEIPKGYIYFAVFFSLGVEFINLKIRDKKQSKKIN